MKTRVALALAWSLIAGCAESHLPCELHGDCPSDLYCDGETCERPPPIDPSEACSCASDADCPAGNVCRGCACWLELSCVDDDGDGYSGVRCDGVTVVGLDCDDADPAIHPGAEEVCDDGVDNDCDDRIDEDCPRCGCVASSDCPSGATCSDCTCLFGPDCRDADHDGYFAGAGCSRELGAEDCDDADSSIHPGGREICGDSIDQNCLDDGDGCICPLGEKRPCGRGRCAGEQLCTPGGWGPCEPVATPEAEICGNAVDDDCDATIDNGCVACEATSCAVGLVCVDTVCVDPAA